MILFYDTGARVQEILNIKLCDLQLGRLPKVTLFGKGRKTHVVPLMEKTVQRLEKYLLAFHADPAPATELPLFYSVTHGEKHPLTSRMAQYILQKYGELAKRFLKRFTHICFVTAERCTYIPEGNGFDACFPMAGAFTVRNDAGVRPCRY